MHYIDDDDDDDEKFVSKVRGTSSEKSDEFHSDQILNMHMHTVMYSCL